MRTGRTRGDRATARRWLCVWLALQVALLPASALANPEDPNVVAGGAVFGGTPQDQVIRTTTDRTIIDWQRFDIGADESVHFKQPTDHYSSVLNRALGVSASQIDGRLTSNARVYIANEAGVFFGGNAVVDVSKLVAVGGQISNENFLAGVDHFTDLTGGVENLGTIDAGSVALVGDWVSNQGTIVASEGSILMLAGDAVWITEVGNPVLIQLTPTGGDAARPDVENSGTLEARSGGVRLAAGDPLGVSIRNTGDIYAKRISLEGGDLTQVAGTLDASASDPGEEGGTIDVTGKRVLVEDGAVLDASGPAGGGTIRVGGDAHGQGELANAIVTRVDAGAELRADASEDGDGGTIVVWADHTADVSGTISARGGQQGGDGGFVETSGKNVLYVDRAPDVSAPEGESGLWLLDPSNVSIVADPMSPAEDLDPAFDDPFFFDDDGAGQASAFLQPTAANSEVSASLISQALEDGNNIAISTQTLIGDGGEVGNITVAETIRVAESDQLRLGALTLLAANDITLLAAGEQGNVNAGAILNDTALPLNVNLFANDQSQPQAEGQETIGTITLNAEIRTGGGILQLNSANIELNNQITTEGGPVSISARGGDIRVNLNDTVDSVVLDTGGASLSIAALAIDNPDAPDGEIDLLGGSVTVGTNALIHTDGGSLVITGNGGNVSLHEGFVDPSSAADGIDTNGGSVAIDAGNQFGIGGNLVIGRTIDSSRKDDMGMLDPDMTGGTQSYQSEAGTSFTLDGDLFTGGGSVILGGDDFRRGDNRINANITTGGGAFISSSEQLLVGEGVVIDLRDDAPGGDMHGDMRANADGDILVSDRSMIVGDEVFLAAGLDGVGDLIFGGAPAGPGRPTPSGDEPMIHADGVTLQAGDGYTADAPEGQPQPDPATRSAQVRTNELKITNLAGVDPLSPEADQPATLTILQDADLDADVLNGLFAAPSVTPVTNYTLESGDGTVAISSADVDTINNTATDLTLGARNDFDIQGTLAVPTVNLRTAESLFVDQTLANSLSGVKSIGIQSGLAAMESESGGSDMPPGDLTIEQNVTLRTAATDGTTPSRISLHAGAGAGGVGDLTFEDNVQIFADEIELRAGNPQGTATTPAKVDAVTGTPRFRAQDGSLASEFTIWQDASISDADIPERTQLSDDNSLAGLDYTLRSDLGSVTVGGTTPGETKVDGSNLTLLAGTGISLSQPINVPVADVGGLGNFVVTQELINDLDRNDGGADPIDLNKLTLRAASGGAGSLTFESGVTVPVDEIRLVAGDGTGGSIAQGTVIVKNPTDESYVAPEFRDSTGNAPPTTFVFRQDQDVNNAALEQLPDIDQFYDESLPGSPQTPETYGIRSDDGGILLATLADVVATTDTLILSADSIDMTATDQDLLFDVGGVATELRGDSIVLTAIGAVDDGMGGTTDARVDAQALTKITGFEGDDLNDSGEFDLTTPPETAPQQFAIESDGDVRSVDDGTGTLRYGLPDRMVFGGPGGTPDLAGMTYDVESNQGDIVIGDEAQVRGSRLILSVEAEDQVIQFPTGLPILLASLDASAQFGWQVGSLVDGGSTPLVIIADESIALGAGLGGEGDLSFAPDVALSANVFQLIAGDGSPINEPDDGSAAPDPPKLDAQSNDPTFVFTGEDPQFTFFSDADIEQTAGRDPLASTLPLASQFLGATADRMLIQSDQGAGSEYSIGNITFDDFHAFFDRVAPKTNTLALDGAVVSLGSPTNLVLQGGDAAPQVDVRAFVVNLSAAGQVLPDGMQLEMTGQFEERSPRAFTITQPGTITAMNLPNADQFAGGLRFAAIDPATGLPALIFVQYGLISEGGNITIDDLLAAKVEDSAFGVQTPNGQTEVKADLDLFSFTADSPVVFLPMDPLNPMDPPETTRMISTLAGQLYVEPITLAIEETQLMGGNVRTLSTIDGTTPGGNSLLIATSDETVIAGDVGQTTRLGALQFQMTAESAQVEFGGIVDASAAANGGTPLSEAEIYAALADPIRVTADSIDFETVITTTDSDGNPTTTGRTTIPTAATVFKRFGDLELTATNGGDITLGRNEKLSVGGDLSLVTDTGCAPGCTIRIGDVSALGISILSDTLEVMLRGSGRVEDITGNTSEDSGVDLLANDFDVQVGTLVFSGSGNRAILGTPIGAAIPALFAPLPNAVARPGGRPINSNDFGIEGGPVEANPVLVPGSDFAMELAANVDVYSRAGIGMLDLRPTGGSRADLAEAFFTPVPPPDPRVPTEWLPDTRRLAAVGVAVRDATAAELESWAEGAAVIDDVSGGTNRMGTTVLVAEPRLLAGEAEKTLVAYRKVFGEYHHRAPQIKRVLAGVVSDYIGETGSRRVVGFELRRYVRNRPNSQQEAYRVLEDLAALYRHHRSLGLAPAEYRLIQRHWLTEITPEGITQDELAEAIHPSRYVRGSDVLDLFGQ